MNKAYVFQPAGEKHSPKNVQEKDRHCHQYLHSKLGRLRQEEHKLKVRLGYTVRPCLKSHKRKEKKSYKNHDANHRKT